MISLCYPASAPARFPLVVVRALPVSRSKTEWGLRLTLARASRPSDACVAWASETNQILQGTVAKVEYTFQYKRGADGNLKIVVHHSSLPYSP